MPRTRSLFAVALTSAATLTLTASAFAWEVESLATAPPPDVGSVGAGHAALSGTGDLAVTWTENTYPRTRGVSGMTRHEMLLTRTPGRADEIVEQPGPRSFIADASTLLAYESAGGRTTLSTRPAGGAFGAFAEVAPAEAVVETSWGGARLVHYAGTADDTVVRLALPGQPLGSPVSLGSEGREGGMQFTVADDGQAVVVWTRYASGATPTDAVVARVRGAGADGVWGPAVTLGQGRDPDLAMGAAGDALVAWQGKTATAAAYRPTVGAFGAAVVASRPYGVGSVHEPRAAIGPDGRGMVLTVKYEGGGLQPIERVDVVDGVAHAPGTVADDARALLGRFATDAEGTAWLLHAAGNDGLAVRRAPTGGAFGPATILTEPGEHTSLSSADLEVDGRGGAAVTWEGSFGDRPSRVALATEELAPAYEPTPDGGGAGGGGAPPAPQTPAPAPAPARPSAPGSATVPQRLAPARAAVVRGLKVRTAKHGRRTLAFTLDSPASVRIVVQRANTGRRAGKACVKPTRKNRSRPSCTRWAAVGVATTHRGVVGANAPSAALPAKAGRYRVTVTPAGGKPTTASFRVGR